MAKDIQCGCSQTSTPIRAEDWPGYENLRPEYSGYWKGDKYHGTIRHVEKLDVKTDAVNHPSHYTSHPSGVECIQVTEHYNFCVGNAIKYLWRAGLKNDKIEDLEKARWYIDREIKRIKNERA